MVRSKKILAIVLSMCLIGTMIPVLSFAAETKADDIVVLYTGDGHGNVDSNLGYDKVAAYKAEKLGQTPNVTLVDAGDSLQGSVMGMLSRGSFPLDIMNLAGYEIMAPGGHDFDSGMAQLIALSKTSMAQYVSANLMNLGTNTAVFKPYVMKYFGTKRVAFVGISSPETLTTTLPSTFRDANHNFAYGFCQDTKGTALYTAVQNAVDSARSAGADYVIALSHLGMNEASSPWTAKEVIANTSGINAVIDGNSDSIISGQLIINKLGGLVTLTSAGPDLKAIGELTISASGNISTDIITSYGDEDANVKTLINRYNDQIASQADQTIARSDVKLTIKEADDSTRAIRNQETNLGDLTADAYRALSDADIALIDGASLRSDIAAGDVTYANVIAANPYGYKMSVVKATGQQILDALEVGARSCPAESSGFLQVSGITYEIDTTVDSNVVFDSKNAFLSIDGSRRVVNVRVNGTAISGTKVYTVASTNNLIDGNIDGLTMFKANEKILKDVMLDNQIIISYMRDSLQGVIGSEYAIPQGRITVITAGDKAGILAYKSALARTTKFSSVKVSSRKIYVKLTGNSKAYGFRYQVYTSGGTLVNNKSKTTTSYNTAKKTKGRKYTVKVTPYTYVMGELVYGKTISKTVTIK